MKSFFKITLAFTVGLVLGYLETNLQWTLWIEEKAKANTYLSESYRELTGQ